MKKEYLEAQHCKK